MFISACQPPLDDSEQTEQPGFPEDSENSEEHRHTPTKFAEQMPTCTESGNREYYVCSGCKLLFKEEACLNKTTVEEEKLASIGHADENENFSCDVCGVSISPTIPGGDDSTEMPKVEFSENH